MMVMMMMKITDERSPERPNKRPSISITLYHQIGANRVKVGGRTILNKFNLAGLLPCSEPNGNVCLSACQPSP